MYHGGGHQTLVLLIGKARAYTIGQRHGFTVTTSQNETVPHYVVSKNMKDNTITVSTNQPKVHGQTIMLTDLNIIGKLSSETCEAQFRYRQKPFQVHLTITDNDRGMLTVLDEHVDMPSVGQSCVLYEKDRCLGGGIIQAIQ